MIHKLWTTSRSFRWEPFLLYFRRILPIIFQILKNSSKTQKNIASKTEITFRNSHSTTEIGKETLGSFFLVLFRKMNQKRFSLNFVIIYSRLSISAWAIFRSFVVFSLFFSQTCLESMKQETTFFDSLVRISQSRSNWFFISLPISVLWQRDSWFRIIDDNDSFFTIL